MGPRARADAALLVVTLAWGVTFPLLRIGLRTLTPPEFVAARFALAVVAFLPLVLLRPATRGSLRSVLWVGMGLGALSYACYITQTVGLKTVPAGRAAFLTGLNVILVPLLSPLFRAGTPTRRDFAAAFIATIGLLVMARPEGAHGLRIGVGEWLILACATLYAAYVHLLQRALRARPNAEALAFMQVLGVMLCAWVPLAWARPWAFSGARVAAWDGSTWWAVLVCALVATVLGFWLQTRHQGNTTPQRAALIFALEPVFAAGFAWVLLREAVTGQVAAGGALILAAVLLAELRWSPPPSTGGRDARATSG